MKSQDLMQIELTAKANESSVGYVAVGFSLDNMMGDESVIECSALKGGSLTLKISYNINATADPSTKGKPTNQRLSGIENSEYFSNAKILFTNGTIYCSGVLNVAGAVNDKWLKFDPNNMYYLLMASGPTSTTALLQHKHVVVSTNPLSLSDAISHNTFDTSTCGQSKGCFIPTEAECYQGCNGMRFSWLMKSSDLLEIELSVRTDANGNAGYVGVGFSTDDMMGDESVIECSALQGEPLSMKLSYNINGSTTADGEPTNQRLSGDQVFKYFVNATTSLSDGMVYCSAVLNIADAVSDGRLKFDTGALYYLLMANGPTSANAKEKGVYSSVGNDSFIYFELVAPSTSKYGTFVAVTFSFDGSMANTPSIECSSLGADDLSMKFSYNDASGKNIRIAGEEIFTYTTSPYVLILTTGSTDTDGLLPSASSYTAALATPLSRNEASFDAGTCNVEKNCVLPDECYRGCNGMGFSYKGNDYVIECSALPNQKYSLKFSYNNDSPKNVRIPGEESIESTYFTQSNIVTVDGELYCSAIVNVSGWALSDQVFTYNSAQAYYLLLASGFTDNSGLTIHKHTYVSTPRLLDESDTPLNSFDTATCGTKKGCFISDQPNAMRASYQVLSAQFIRIELSMKTSTITSLYLALGFSFDNQMGNDNVIECSALTGQSLSMKFSYNPNHTNARIKGEETIRSQYFQNETAAITDGVLYCTAVVDVRGWPSSNGQVFQYNANQTYYLLLAAGSALSSSLTQHKTTDVSSPRLLTDYDADSSNGMNSTTKGRLIKAHAILMLLAWFIFVPTAAMFARFLRSSWPTLRPGGILIWFHVHRTSNSIAITLMTASFICILTANNWKWKGPGSHSGKWVEAHTMIGIIALCLAWMQPFVSAMRCNPSHPRRPYFNWVHRGIGATAMVLATTAIAIAAYHFLSIWPHQLIQLVLSLVPLVLILSMSTGFLLVDRKDIINDLNFKKVQRNRELVVYIAVIITAAVAITLSVFVGIGA
ncbi:unnamed protein product [Cylicocyclus nassatus]|uniref:Cytochrome b561 domain-containing protein n=1 Tax=Cylicocyclus nassatus TaxID=53992 RepID=A0AA36HC06_CYLNA|nr:unnamed protein product [Cylicocyclus nassatus]